MGKDSKPKTAKGAGKGDKGGDKGGKDFFRTWNVLPFSCTHLALWRQGKRPKVHAKQKGFKNFFISRISQCQPWKIKIIMAVNFIHLKS